MKQILLNIWHSLTWRFRKYPPCDPGTTAYWVSGKGHWRDGSHWADEDGNVLKQVPTENNTVYFNSRSFKKGLSK